MARTIDIKLFLEGEKEFQDGLQGAYAAIKELGNQIKIADAKMKTSGGGLDDYRHKAKLLEQQIEKQKDLLKQLGNRMEEVESQYGQNSYGVTYYAKRIDKASKTLQRMERDLQQTEDAIQQLDNAAEAAGDMKTDFQQAENATEGLGNAADEARAKLEALKNAMKGLDGIADGLKSEFRGIEKALDGIGDEAGSSAKDLQRLEDASKRLEKTGDRLRGGWNIAKDITADILQDALYAGFEKVKDFVQEGIQSASDLEEVTNVVDTAFGSSADSIREFADEAIYRFGLSSQVAQEYAGKFGAAFKALGLGSEALEMSKTLTGLTGDLASFWNLSADEAYTKLFSGVISGETEGLKSLGIVMTEAELNSYAMAEGIRRGTKNMTAAEKAALRYRYVLSRTAQAQGDFAKTSDSYANQMRVAELSTQNLGQKMGTAMLPALTELLGKYNEFANRDETKDLFADLGEGLGNLATDAFDGISTAITTIAENREEIAAVFKTMGGAAIGAGLAKTLKTVSDLYTKFKSLGGLAGTLGKIGVGGYVAIGATALAGVNATIDLMTQAAAQSSALQQALKNLDMSLDPASQQEITNGINAGIEAANKEYEIQLKINADMQGLQDQLDEFFSPDSKEGEELSRSEYKEASGALSQMVKEDIKAAQTALEEYEGTYKETLKSLVNSEGEQLMTEEEMDSAIGTLTAETQTLITELETAYTEYDTLLKNIYKGNRTATEEEIAQLEALLGKIGEIRAQLAIANDEALQLQKTYYEQTKSGYGNLESAGFALGYIGQTTENEIDRINQEYEQKRIQYLNMKEQGVITDDELGTNLQNLESGKLSQLAETYKNQTQGLNEVFDGLAKSYPQAAAAVEQAGKAYDAYANYSAEAERLREEAEKNAGVGGKDITAGARALAESSEELLDAGLVTEEAMEKLKTALAEGSDVLALELSTEIGKQMSEKMAEIVGGLEDNPIAALFQEMITQLDPATIDLTAVDGVLEAMFKADDFTQKGTDVANYIMTGIGQGLEAGTQTYEATLQKTFQASTEKMAQTVGQAAGQRLSAGFLNSEAVAGMTGNAQTALDSVLGVFEGVSITIPIEFELGPMPDIPGVSGGGSTGGANLSSAVSGVHGAAGILGGVGGARNATTALSSTNNSRNVTVNQTIYANETSYAGQQAEAGRQARMIARALG